MTDTPYPREAKRYENLLVVILFLAFGFVFFDRQAVPFLFPFISEDIGLTNTQLGIVTAVLAVSWAVSGAAVGKLSDRLGVRKPILLVAILAFSTFSALSGFVTGFLSLLLIRALMGIAEGAVLPMAQSLMIEASEPRRRGLNMGLVQTTSSGLLGGVLAPPIIVGLAQVFGWRTAFYLTIIPGLLIALWVWRTVRERPPASPLLQEDGTWAEPAGHKPSVGEVIRMRNIWLCMLIAVCMLTWFILILTFTPTYLVTEKGLAPGTMATVMTFLGIAWVIWGTVTPAISDRIGRKTTVIAFSAVAVFCPLAIVFIGSPTGLSIAVALTFVGIGVFSLFMATIPGETVSHGALATALGLVMGIGEIAGGAIAPVIAGIASDAWGLQSAMYIAAGGAVIATLLAFGLHETAPRVLARRGIAHAEVPGVAEYSPQPEHGHSRAE
ncbi:MFS transporter [Pseudonocardia charpentierae]|uniref:MFS transporter n=1 Tax=Pseudonocardia charpentierae TaxID=3075545 RepID=A0ABU2NIJ6_9PSEU|nr:MFS transporter [Pseudonocardia sp. DSM 45834]MDT0353795.1 MFS transporter [Pseudonocardia sp. DSM 45834]